jgi:hypothetical protein
MEVDHHAFPGFTKIELSRRGQLPDVRRVHCTGRVRTMG